MKKNLLLSLAAVLLLCTACVDINLGKGGKKLKPSDNLVKNEYKMEPFTELELDVVAKVKYVQGEADDYRVVLQAPENYVDLFDIKVDGDELEIGFVKNSLNIEAKNIGIVVYAPTLRKLEIRGVAEVRTDSLMTDELKVENEGVGNLKLMGLNVKNIDVKGSGVGNITLAGTAERATLNCSGVGNINAEELKAVAVKADVSGVGSVSCYSSERLKGDVSGVGSLRYSGQPKEKQLHRSGVGKISEQ